MITEKDLQEAIAECKGKRNPDSSTCIKLAAFLIIQEHLYRPGLARLLLRRAARTSRNHYKLPKRHGIFGGDRRQTSRRCVACHGRTHGSAAQDKQAALQRNYSQNSRLTHAKGEPEKSGSFFF